MRTRGVVGVTLTGDGKIEDAIVGQDVALIGTICGLMPDGMVMLQLGDYVAYVRPTALEKASRNADEIICGCTDVG